MARRGPLGIILTPYGHIPGAYPSEISRTTHGGAYLCPPDPQYNTRAQVGLYYDTPLGATPRKLTWGERRALKKAGLGDIPNDFELAKVRGILTPNQGWVMTQNGPYNDYWVPPNGWTPTQPTGVRINLPTNVPGGLGATGDDVVTELTKHHRNMFALGVLSTAAVLVSSVIAAIRTARLMRAEKHNG